MLKWNYIRKYSWTRKIIDDLSKAMKTYSKMIGSDKEAMDKIASTMQRNDKDNANKIANRN